MARLDLGAVAPIEAAGATFGAVAGRPFLGVVATFTAADADAPARSFRATIRRGERHARPASRCCARAAASRCTEQYDE